MIIKTRIIKNLHHYSRNIVFLPFDGRRRPRVDLKSKDLFHKQFCLQRSASGAGAYDVAIIQ